MCGARPLVALLAKNGGICVMVSNSTLPLGFLSIATIILLNGGRFLSSVLLSSVYLFPYTFLSNRVQRYNIILKYPRISCKKTIDGDEFIEMWQEYYDKMSDEDKNMLPLKRISFLGNNEKNTFAYAVRDLQRRSV